MFNISKLVLGLMRYEYKRKTNSRMLMTLLSINYNWKFADLWITLCKNEAANCNIGCIYE